MAVGDEMAPGEIARTLGRLDEGQKELVRAQREGQQAVMSELALMRGEFVNHREYEAHNRVTEDEINDAHEETATLKRETVAAIATLKRELVGVVAFVITAALGIVGAYIQSGRL